MKLDLRMVGIVSGALTSAMPTVQVGVMLWTRNVSGVSVLPYVAFMLGMFGWLYYGLQYRDWVFSAWNIWGILMCGVVVALKILIGGSL